MRIIGGTAGGRILKVPKGLAVRPTPDLVRQAVFNSLGPRVPEASVLELFAGSGALSLECLSRGAQSAVCVELSGRHAAFIRENLRDTGIEPSLLEVRTQDAYAAIRQLAELGRRFSLIFADPPYGEKNLKARSQSHAQKLLDDPHLPSLLAPGGLFILGHASRDTLTLPQERWHERKSMRHGDSMMRFLESAPPSPANLSADLSAEALA
jgi:16S rRNA (guanine966-N2)-methyltransferase